MSAAFIARSVASLSIAALFGLSLAFATSFPDRISVLPNLQVDAQTYDAIALDLSNRRSLDAIPPLQPPGFVALLAVVSTPFGHSWITARLATITTSARRRMAWPFPMARTISSPIAGA